MVFTAYFLGTPSFILRRHGRQNASKNCCSHPRFIPAVLVALAMFALMAGFDVINTLLVITFLTGGAGAFSIPAIGALVPDLVEEEILPQANALCG